MDYLDKYHMINNNQIGFRKKLLNIYGSYKYSRKNYQSTWWQIIH